MTTDCRPLEFNHYCYFLIHVGKTFPRHLLLNALPRLRVRYVSAFGLPLPYHLEQSSYDNFQSDTNLYDIVAEVVKKCNCEICLMAQFA